MLLESRSGDIGIIGPFFGAFRGDCMCPCFCFGFDFSVVRSVDAECIGRMVLICGDLAAFNDGDFVFMATVMVDDEFSSNGVDDLCFGSYGDGDNDFSGGVLMAGVERVRFILL